MDDTKQFDESSQLGKTLRFYNILQIFFYNIGDSQLYMSGINSLAPTLKTIPWQTATHRRRRHPMESLVWSRLVAHLFPSFIVLNVSPCDH